MAKILKFPMREQRYDFDCSVAVAWSFLKYNKIKIDYSTLLKASKVCPVDGLRPEKLVNLLKKFGLDVTLERNKTLKFIKSQINHEKPVIILLQSRKEYRKSWKNTWMYGHYGIIFGFDDHRVFMYDPSIGGVRVFTYDQLNLRWHDELRNEIFNKTVIFVNNL